MLPVYSLILISIGVFGILYISKSSLVFNFIANDLNFSYLSTYLRIQNLNIIFWLLIIFIIIGILGFFFSFFLYLRQNKII